MTPALATVAVLWLLAAGAQAQGPGNVETVKRGHALALLICAACHVVAADQESAPILREPGPSFQAIADRSTTTSSSLRDFLTSTHTKVATAGEMPNPQLAEYQMVALVAYILSLRHAE